MRTLIRLGYRDHTDDTDKTLLLTNRRSFRTRPTDTPAHAQVHARVTQPGLVRRDTFDVNQTGGASRIGFGATVCPNEDGFFDGFRKHAVDGRALDVLVSDDDHAAVPGGYTVAFSGTMVRARVDFTSATFRVRDRQAFARLPLTTTKYGGTNPQPDGVDGTPSDLIGKTLPVCYGWCENVTPVLVNPALMIYQANDRAVHDVWHVYDGGGFLGKGADYETQEQMESEQPAAGTYRVWKAGGMFRIRGVPAQQLTCDVIEGRWPSDRTIAQIVKRILIERAGFDAADITAADITTHDVAQPGSIGMYFPSGDVLIQDALDIATRSSGSWWATDRLGKFRIQRLELPRSDEASVVTITERMIDREGFDAAANEGETEGMPVYRVTVRGVPNYTVQTTNLLGVVPTGRRARLAQAFLDGVAEDSAVQAVHPFAVALDIESRFVCLADVQAEAERQQTMRAAAPDVFVVPIKMTAALVAALDLGKKVTLMLPRFGFDDGATFRAIGYELNHAKERITLSLWGTGDEVMV